MFWRGWHSCSRLLFSAFFSLKVSSLYPISRLLCFLFRLFVYTFLLSSSVLVQCFLSSQLFPIVPPSYPDFSYIPLFLASFVSSSLFILPISSFHLFSLLSFFHLSFSFLLSLLPSLFPPFVSCSSSAPPLSPPLFFHYLSSCRYFSYLTFSIHLPPFFSSLFSRFCSLVCLLLFAVLLFFKILYFSSFSSLFLFSHPLSLTALILVLFFPLLPLFAPSPLPTNSPPCSPPFFNPHFSSLLSICGQMLCLLLRLSGFFWED